MSCSCAFTPMVNPSILVNSDDVDFIDFVSPAQSASVNTSIVATSSVFRGLSCTVRNSHSSLCPSVYRTHCHEAVSESLNDAVMSSTNSEVSSEEPEFVWTVLCQAMTQKTVRKADTNWTDQDSEDQKCFSCVTVRIGGRVINVECTKQDMIALSAIQSESYSLTTGDLGRVPSEDNETILGYEIPRTRPHREMYDEDGNVDCEGLGWRTVASGFGHWGWSGTA